MSRILEQPDIEGPAGRAWLCREKKEEARQNLTAELEILLVEHTENGSEPKHKVLTLSHLRESDLLGTPDIAKPGATHELRVWGVNPDTENSIDPHDASTLHPLYPPIVEQFSVPNDSVAMHLTETIAQLFVCDKFDLECNSPKEWDKLISEQTSETIH